MLKLLFLLPAGIFAHSLLPALPGVPWFLCLLLVSAICLFVGRWFRIAGFFLLGLALGGLWANQQMQHRLPVALDKTDVTLSGTVSSLPSGNAERTVFDLKVTGIHAAGAADLPPLQKLRLSWYGPTELAAGETWQLQVRLRSPRGFSNPGAFDYSARLLAEGISATGYVRDSSFNRRLSPAPRYSLQRLRQQLLNDFARQADIASGVPGIMAALVLGEYQLIPAQVFRHLKQTGTVHLVVVSGLQISMVTGLCLLVGMGLGRLAVAMGAAVPARILAIPVALAAALAYSLLAGFDLPVQRSLIMSVAALTALFMRRSTHIWHVFGLALSVVALLDPMAGLSAGFWLSFVAVFSLLGWFSHRPAQSLWHQLWKSQLVVFICLAPWLTYFQGNVSLWSLPVNLVAIPWVSLSIVPCCLLGALLQGLPPLADFCWMLAAVQTEAFLKTLAWVAEHSDVAVLSRVGLSPTLSLASGNLLLLAGLMLVAVLFLLPRGLGKAIPMAVVVVALWLHRAGSEPALALDVLDVGQGLAAVIRVRDRVLVYDTGPGYPSGFNTGEAVVSPYLEHLGIDTLDRLIVSHGDRDHAGGVEGLLEDIDVVDIIAGQPQRVAVKGARPCHAGMHWRWYDVSFRVLWPPQGVGQLPAKLAGNNNHSCVLLVEMGSTRILLPGDIETPVEQFLVQHYWQERGGDMAVVIAPHHGSKTSSSGEFVRALRPRYAVFTTGYNHHFGHPHADVEARYAAVGTRRLKTALSGAVQFRWNDHDELLIAEYRQQYRRYWH